MFYSTDGSEYNTQLHQCGNCIHHVCRNSNAPLKLRSGHLSYWVCDLTGHGKIFTNGRNCDDFENRYMPKDKSDQWLKAVTKYRRGKKGASNGPAGRTPAVRLMTQEELEEASRAFK